MPMSSRRAFLPPGSPERFLRLLPGVETAPGFRRFRLSGFRFGAPHSSAKLRDAGPRLEKGESQELEDFPHPPWGHGERSSALLSARAASASVGQQGETG